LDRNTLSFLELAHVLFGKPASTFRDMREWSIADRAAGGASVRGEGVMSGITRLRPLQIAAGIAAGLCIVVTAAVAEVKRPERVTILGCPYPGVTANCLMIKAANGAEYNISSVSPRPRLSGRMIRVRGSITNKLSACGQGIVLDRIRWTRTRQRCPN
jgi:hypothetical protein